MNWGITTGKAGMQAQVLGVLEALGQPFVMKTCHRKKPFVWLPNDIPLNPLKQLAPESDALDAPWPPLVVTCGRRSAPFGPAIKKASGGKTIAVHLQGTGMRVRPFDIVVAMEHDELSGSNVLVSKFALHSLTQEKLAAARAKWEPEFAAYPAPRIAVLIGGSTNKYTFTENACRQLTQRLSSLLHHMQGGSLLITTSRRTGEGNIVALRNSFRSLPKQVFFYAGEGENPYHGMLACADYLVVTNDSVSMMSEAAYTGKPLYILPLMGHENTKPAHFAEMLIREGIARPLTHELATWANTVPDERQRVVDAIHKLLSSRT